MRARLNLRGAVFAILVALLSACQTMPADTGFRSDQVSALEGEGFKRVGENYELGIGDRILFGFDKSRIQPETAETLSHLADVLTKVGIYGALVEGHTDDTGDAQYNHRLSEQRAIAVKDVLVASGMNADRVRASGLGESDPIESNATEEGRKQNRRVVIVVAPADTIPL